MHSTSPPCGNLVDAVNWPDPGPAKIHDFGRHFDVFGDISYHELLVCYIQIIHIISNFDFL